MYTFIQYAKSHVHSFYLIAPPVSKIPRLGKSRCAPKNDGDKILNITPTTIADYSEIEPQWRHLTMAGMSDKASVYPKVTPTVFYCSPPSSEAKYL